MSYLSNFAGGSMPRCASVGQELIPLATMLATTASRSPPGCWKANLA